MEGRGYHEPSICYDSGYAAWARKGMAFGNFAGYDTLSIFYQGFMGGDQVSREPGVLRGQKGIELLWKGVKRVICFCVDEMDMVPLICLKLAMYNCPAVASEVHTNEIRPERMSSLLHLSDISKPGP